ncbi:DUF1508 domain-containing protein [Arthrobacter sp. UYCu712]|uniref:YegP family protein n=1 Tax=Arthrobacter sp. UYCu712 TaxID=3156340 RepID=UPI00339A0A86
MAGMFELFTDEVSGFRFRITAPDGTVMAVSRRFPDKQSAVDGIRAVRDYAGMGHITDLCPAPSAGAVTGPVPPPDHRTGAAPGRPGTRRAQTLTRPRTRVITAA